MMTPPLMEVMLLHVSVFSRFETFLVCFFFSRENPQNVTVTSVVELNDYITVVTKWLIVDGWNLLALALFSWGFNVILL